MRNWKEMQNDEIYAIWSGYVLTSCNGWDPLRLNYYERAKTIRLTPIEIHHLVEELLDRLEIKDKE